MLIIDRILQLIENERITQADFCKKTKLNPATLSNTKKQNGFLKENSIRAVLAAYPNISWRWLIFGEGEMWKKVYQNQSEAGFLIQEKPAHYESMGANKSETDPTVAQLRREIELLKGMVEDKETIIQLLKKNQQ